MHTSHTIGTIQCNRQEDRSEGEQHSTDTSVDGTAIASRYRSDTGNDETTEMSSPMDNMLPSYASAAFVLAARPIIDRGNRRRPAETQSFGHLFGTTPTIAATIWMYIRYTLPPDAMPKHLLWGLLLLKVYATEPVNVALSGVHRETFRHWAWIFIEAMSNLPTVSPITPMNIGNQTKKILTRLLCRLTSTSACLMETLQLQMCECPLMARIAPYRNRIPFHPNGFRTS